MIGTSQDTHYLWQVVTHLGSGSLMLPLAGITAVGLWRTHQQASLRVWFLAMTAAVVVTLVTKIAFIGWGIGIAALNFTGISGHTLIATSVLPFLFGWLLARDGERFRNSGVLLGLLLGGVVGSSRVVLGMHSSSEVMVAWIAGLIVSAVALNSLVGRVGQPPLFVRLSPLALLLSFSTTTSTYLPTHEWEVAMALLLSGRDTPYTRHQMMWSVPPSAALTLRQDSPIGLMQRLPSPLCARYNRCHA